jgi:phage-related protein
VSDNIKKAWTTFWDAVSKKASDIWDAIKKYISDKIDAVKTYLDTVSTNIKTAWTTFWDIVSKKASDIWDTIKTYISTKIDAVKTYLDTVSTNIKTAWTNFWDAVSLKASNIWDAIKLYISTKIDKVKGYIDTVSTNISTAWTTFWDNIKLKASGIWDDIKLKVSGALDTIKGYFGSAADGTGFIGGLATKWDTFWTNFKNTIVGIWDGENGIKTKVSNAIEAVKGYFTNAAGTGLLDKIGKVATDVWTKFYNIGWNLVDAIKTGVSDAAAALWKGIGGLVGKLIDIIKNLLGMGSPSKVFMDIGNQMMQGMDIGIRAHAILPKNAMMEAMLPITRAAQVPITQGTSNYYQPNITMHNNINNGMSVPYLQALIIRTVKKGMTS